MNVKDNADSQPEKRGRKSLQKNGFVLSPREEEILHHLADGKQYNEVGELLFISTETVRKHAANIYRKLEVRNSKEAIKKHFGSQTRRTL